MHRIEEFVNALSMEQYGLYLKKDQHSREEVHFLDLQINIDLENVTITVYRKPTYVPVVIPNWSKDPIGYKKSAFRSFYRRAFCTVAVRRA